MSDQAIQKGYTKRYLPERAWAKLTPEQRRQTDQKKREGSRRGEQFIDNTDSAKKASKAVRAASKYRRAQ